jgi:hypothetical protein
MFPMVTHARISSPLHIQLGAGQSRLVRAIRLSSLLPQQVVDPRTLWRELDAPAVHDGKIQPRRGVADGANLVADVRPRVPGHSHVQLIVSVQIVQVLRHLGVVSWSDKISGFPVLDLERDSTSAAGDNRLAVVNSFGDLDLEAFTGRELQRDFGVG